MDIIPSGQTPGARVEGIELEAPVSDADFRTLLRALGQHGVLCFPQQTFDTAAFARRFGDLDERSSTPIPATRSASMAWTRTRAIRSWITCSAISSGRIFCTRITGRSATC
jgi:alpha-ketoglutarate-dependent taurine dioxygenase